MFSEDLASHFVQHFCYEQNKSAMDFFVRNFVKKEHIIFLEDAIRKWKVEHSKYSKYLNEEKMTPDNIIQLILSERN